VSRGRHAVHGCLSWFVQGRRIKHAGDGAGGVRGTSRP
jgi:hypothetical protein